MMTCLEMCELWVPIVVVARLVDLPLHVFYELSSDQSTEWRYFDRDRRMWT